MDKKVEEYISSILSKIAILDEDNVGFENVEIFDFKVEHENGRAFTHQNGENYGLAFLNAITEESAKKITREIKKNKRMDVFVLTQLVEKHRLKCYVKGGSRSYRTWEVGDRGVAYLEFDDEKKIIVPRFVNESAENRS
jgi:hypothetical protein